MTRPSLGSFSLASGDRKDWTLGKSLPTHPDRHYFSPFLHLNQNGGHFAWKSYVPVKSKLEHLPTAPPPTPQAFEFLEHFCSKSPLPWAKKLFKCPPPSENNQIRDWSKSTEGGGGWGGGPEHFEMWWLENTWPTPSNSSKTEWPTAKWRLKIKWPTPPIRHCVFGSMIRFTF